jgi:hypothetical protein
VVADAGDEVLGGEHYCGCEVLFRVDELL